MKIRFFIFMLCLSILNASCTKELKYSRDDLLARAQDADPTVTIILPRSMSEGVHCAEYSEGCLSGYIIKVQGLEMIAVEFTTEEQAKFAARKFRGYYSRNWLFDDVMGEPVLEKFVSTVLDGKKP